MQKQLIEFSETQQFSSLFLDYISQRHQVLPLQTFSPNLEGIKEALRSRTFDSKKREILVQELSRQYANIATSDLTQQNIDSLRNDNTFVVTCGHQLNVFTGPLYFIYKILSTLQLAERLNKEFPKYNFVPVYWMASEDHDFKEINHFQLFGKKYIWDYDAKGAVGKIPCKDMEEFLNSLPQETQHLTAFYRESETLADATAMLVNALFGNLGLLVLNPDVKSLRSLFSEYFLKELTERKSYEIIQNNSKLLESLGYKAQAGGREINLMYAQDKLRERLVYEGGTYKVNNTAMVYTEQEIKDICIDHPERLSTNVILRPIYQEVILPNIAFVGGPAEVTYWLQLKEVFAYFNVPMPVVLPRNFVMILNGSQATKIRKAGLELQDILLTENDLKSKIAAHDLVLDFSKEEELMSAVKQLLTTKAEQVDKSLAATVAAEHLKAQKILDDLQKKLTKAVEKRNSDTITQILNIKLKLYPEGNPQERVENFMTFYLNDPAFIHKVYNIIDALEFKYYIVEN